MRKKVPIFTNSSVIKTFVEKLNGSPSVELINELTGNQYSLNSVLGILNDWNRYREFCLSHHIATLPASITAIRRFLETESQNRKFASLKRYTATLSLLHIVLSYPNPIRHRQVRFTLLHLQAAMANDAKTTNALTRAHLLELNALLSKSPNVKQVRDRAIYNIMFECALKRSELKSLTCDNVSLYSSEETDSIYHIQVSDQVYSLSDSASCYLTEWLDIIDRTPSLPLFRAIDKHSNVSLSQLNDSSIYRILRSASDILELPESHKFSGNSIRVGAVQELSKQGLKVKEIQDFGRWLSPAMPAQYVGEMSIAEREKTRFKAIVPWQ